MSSERTLLGLRGHIIDTPAFGRLRFRRDGAVIIDAGRIAEVGDYAHLRRKPRDEPVRWAQYEHAVIFPGLIDLHSHVPQYPVVARGESELLPWLRQQVFPCEKNFAGPKGRREAALFFQELARHGTTTAMLYTAIFEDTCDASFEAASRLGLRVIMGKMMMDVGSYGQLQPKKVLSISLIESERLCRKWHGANDGLIEYAFSPRFAVSCSEKLMRGAAELAAQNDAYIQTHLAENAEEIAKVQEQFRWAGDYTNVYDACGLLSPKTMLGHCIHLSDKEIDAIARTQSNVAHCPTANFFLTSGLMKLDQIRAAGIEVGLGSDVAAGPELNLWQVMRSAIETQKARSYYEPAVQLLKPAEALYLGTQGGARALGKGDLIGTIDIGKDADIAVWDLPVMLPYRKQHKVIADLTGEDILALCIYRGGPHALLETFVRGRSIYRAPEPQLF